MMDFLTNIRNLEDDIKAKRKQELEEKERKQKERNKAIRTARIDAVKKLARILGIDDVHEDDIDTETAHSEFTVGEWRVRFLTTRSVLEAQTNVPAISQITGQRPILSTQWFYCLPEDAEIEALENQLIEYEIDTPYHPLRHCESKPGFRFDVSFNSDDPDTISEDDKLALAEKILVCESNIKAAIETIPSWKANAKSLIEEEKALREEISQLREQERLAREMKRQERQAYLESLDGQYLTIIKDMSDEQLQTAMSMLMNEIIERKVAAGEEW